jgi:hypothetical protein
VALRHFILIQCFLSFNAFDIESLGSGIGIYSRLYQVCEETQSLETTTNTESFGDSGHIIYWLVL